MLCPGAAEIAERRFISLHHVAQQNLPQQPLGLSAATKDAEVHYGTVTFPYQPGRLAGLPAEARLHSGENTRLRAKWFSVYNTLGPWQ